MSGANVSFKYNSSEDELKILSLDSESTSKKPEENQSAHAVKSEKTSVSLIDKYLKSFKHEKHLDDSKTHADKEVSKKKISEKDHKEVTGSPIKDYFHKLSKRTEHNEVANDSDVGVKEKDLHERWKLFSDIKGKIAQAVEDIKSSKTEGVERNNSLDNSSLTDSEDNSIQQDLEYSCASTENQVSSIASSMQNLSDLSPPLISQSSTMTDSQEEHSSSSNVTNKNTTTPTRTRKESENKHTDVDFLDEEDDNIDLEIESGVDALEGFDLIEIKGDNTGNENETIIKPYESKPNNHLEKKPFLTYTLMSFTSLVVGSFLFFSSFLMFNGFLLGIWFVYFANNLYNWVLDYLGLNKPIDHSNDFDFKTLKVTKLNQIVEFEPLKKYEGWINIYTLGTYNPLTYHISETQTVFIKLEGCHLRLSFPSNKISKRAHWDEKIPKVDFYQHRLYDLEGAKVKLLPTGIVKKRYWSKKYPICIVLKDKSKVVIYNAQSHSVDSNTPLPKEENGEGDSSKLSESCSTPKKQKSDLSKTNTKNLGSDGKTSVFEAIKEYHHSPSKTRKSDENTELLDDDEDVFEDSFADPPIDSTTLCSNTDEVNDEESNEKFKETSNDDDDLFKSDDGKWSKNEVDEETVLYLFARTGRDKDEWFHRLKTAIEDADTMTNLKSAMNSTAEKEEEFEFDLEVTKTESTSESIKYGSESRVQLSSTKIERKLIGSSEMPSVLWTPAKGIKESPLTEAFQSVQEVDFWKYMRDIIKNKALSGDSSSDNLIWMNAFVGRFIYDTFRNPVWVSEFQDRIQRKLSTLKLPPFMGPLTVTTLDLGCDAPRFYDVSTPVMDSRGFWIYFQMSYTGHAMMTLTTQLNLMSLKEKKVHHDDPSKVPYTIVTKQGDSNTLAVYHSDVEDSAESSSDDEAGPSQSMSLKPTDLEVSTAASPNAKESSSKKLLRIVDKIAANKYFQQVTEYKYVKRAMEGVSNTDLKLSVELRSLSGCLAVNMPPSPSDRIWLGFKGNPNLCLRAKPIVGSHVINFTQVTNWIERRLCSEFEKLLVLPNMEDINLDCMMSSSID